MKTNNNQNISSSKVSTVRTSDKTLNMTYIAIFAALIAICSWISIPASVPFTMQTFAVFLACGLLGGKLALSSVIVYILIGAVGLPVFSGFKGGLGAIFGVTGGYLLGFILTCLCVWLFEKLLAKKNSIFILSLVIGLVLCYSFGTLWFMFIYTKNTGTIGVGSVLGMCVFPFIIPDIIKMTLAVILTKKLKKYVNIKI